jgi:hypothetical protein
MKNKLLVIINSNQFKAFVWQTANNFVVFVTLVLAEDSLTFANKVTIMLVAQPILNAATKYTNKKYLSFKK